MAIHLTPDMLERAYELLRASPPFRGWNLPHGEQVGFHVVGGSNVFGCTVYDTDTKRFDIKISAKKHTQLPTLLPTMAHEMCHMREWQLKVRADVHHGAVFEKLAAYVCRRHGFDRGQF